MTALATAPYSHELNWPPHLRPFDLWDESIKADPYAHYDWMRAHAPVLRVRTPTGDAWFLSRYRDVQWAFRTPKVFSSRFRDPAMFPNMVASDEPDHTRLRSIIAYAFHPKAVAGIEGHVRALTEKSLRALLDSGGGDVIGDFAIPLTTSTIAGFLGLSLSRTDQFRQWTEDYTSFLGRIMGSSLGSPTDEAGTSAFLAYLNQALSDAPTGGDSLLSRIAQARREGEISENEASSFGPLLFDAGTQTTSLLIGNGFIVLSRMPQLLDRLRLDPTSVPKFIEELVRYRTTAHRQRRITTEDVDVSGYKIPSGSVVYLLLAAANLDADKFPDPDIFNMDRDTGGHLGFGFGMHACLGAWLSRMEMRTVFEAVARSIRGIEFDPEAERAIVPLTVGTGGVGGPKALHLRLTPTR